MALGRIVAVISILSLLAITVSLGGQCDVDCTVLQNFTLIADPYNCNNYYTCYEGKPSNQPTPCPPGEEFSLGKCITSTTLPCAPLCQSDHTPTCNVACTSTVRKVNDPMKCDIYYDCASGVPGSVRQCPLIVPYFNSKNNLCGRLESVCCTFNCDPVCFKAPKLIPDYYNSTQYYVCHTLGTPSEEVHFSCPHGQHFDITSGLCSETMPKWESSCSTSLSPSPTVTTTVSSSSTASTPVTPTPACAESMTCVKKGFFPKCNYCDPEYFYCEQVGKPAVVQKCTGTLLFSPDPLNPFCILPSQCVI